MDVQALRNRDKVIKLSDQTKGTLDGWLFKNIFFGLLFFKAAYKTFFAILVTTLKRSKVSSIEKIKEILKLSGGKDHIWDLMDLRRCFQDYPRDQSDDVLSRIVFGINEIELPDKGDSLGEFYEYLLDEFATRGGKAGGEFFTPRPLTELLFQVCMAHRENMEWRKVYDPTCGSGSLLLKFKNIKGIQLFGQEINAKITNLAKLNLLAADVDNTNIRLGDTLMEDKHSNYFFDVVVANPPYTLKWNNDHADPNRFKWGIPPNKAADWAFHQHMVNKVKDTGIVATLCFPSCLYRSGAEENIRKNMVKEGLVRAVIQLPENLFYGTTVSCALLIFTKSKNKNILFIDASKLFKKTQKKQWTMEADQIEKIAKTYGNFSNNPDSFEAEAGFSTVKTNEEVLEMDGNLNPVFFLAGEQVDEEEEEWKRLNAMPFLEATRELEEDRFQKNMILLRSIYKFEKYMETDIKDITGEYEPRKILVEAMEKSLKPIWEKHLKEEKQKQ